MPVRFCLGSGSMSVPLHSGVNRAVETGGNLLGLSRARAETEPYPHNIPHLHRLKQYEDVLRQWRKAEHGVSRTLLSTSFSTAIEMGDVEAMRILLPSATELEQVLLCLERCPRNQVSDLKGAVPVAIARALENKQEWKELVKFAKTGVTDYGKLNDAFA